MTNPGRIGLTSIHGVTGRAIAFGQWLNGDGFSPWEHAFMDLGDGTIIEAEPGGARIRLLSKYDNAEVYWCDNIYAQVSDQKREKIAFFGRDLEGRPYSLLDYEALFCHRLGIPVPGLRTYIADSGHLICSQLCDLAYQRADFQIFNDGRWNGYVTPGDLFRQDQREAYNILTWDDSWEYTGWHQGAAVLSLAYGQERVPTRVDEEQA